MVIQQVCLQTTVSPVFIPSKLKQHLFYTSCLMISWTALLNLLYWALVFHIVKIHVYLSKSEASWSQWVIPAISVNLDTQVLTHGWLKFFMKSFSFHSDIKMFWKKVKGKSATIYKNESNKLSCFYLVHKNQT